MALKSVRLILNLSNLIGLGYYLLIWNILKRNRIKKKGKYHTGKNIAMIVFFVLKDEDYMSLT